MEDLFANNSAPPDTADNPAVDYFDEVHAAFLNAEAGAAESESRHYSVAGAVIRLRFAGSTLVPSVTSALAHLATEGRPRADLTVCVWDSATTATPLPTPPWSERADVATREILSYNTGRVRLAVDAEMSAISMMDRGASLAISWVRSPEHIPPWDVAAPLRTVFHWLLGSETRQLVHGGAVGNGTNGAMLIGPGGSGKSTTALMCLRYGLQCAGDDYVVLTVESKPCVWSLYNSAKLKPDSLARFPDLAPEPHEPERSYGGKSIVYLKDHFPALVVQHLPVDAVVLPRVTGGRTTRLVGCSRAEALTAVAPSSMFQLPDGHARSFATIVQLIRQVDCYRLEIGMQSSNAPELIAEMLKASGRP